MRRTVQVHHSSLQGMGQRFIGAWNKAAKGNRVNETHVTFLNLRTMHNPAHPGEILQGWLSDLGLGVANTAAHLGIGRATLSRILNGHSGISADVDLRLSEAFGTSPGYWLCMQAAHDVWQAKAKAKSRPKIKRLPDSVIETLHLISSPANAAKLASAIAQDRAGTVTTQDNPQALEGGTTTATLPAGTVWDWATDGGISAHRISEYCSQQDDDEAKLLFQYVAAVDVTALREKIESNGEGAGFDVLHCVRKCGTHDLVIPEWLVYAFNQRYDAVNHCRAMSWDDAFSFGKPWPKGTRQNAEQKKRDMPFKVWELVNEAVLSGRSVNLELHKEIAKRLGSNKSDVQQYYRLALNGRMQLHNPVKLREQALEKFNQRKDGEAVLSQYLFYLNPEESEK